MMLGDKAASAMYRFLCENSETIGVKKNRIFKYERPEKLTVGDYIVVNHLPFTHRDIISEGVVNVNVHSPRTVSNEPAKKLQIIVGNLLAVFGEERYLGGAYFEPYSDSRPTPDNDGTYYINLKFNITYNNLKD